jgi:multiple sugar transport system substrate-binding protein
MSTNLSRRNFLKATAAVSAGTLLAACAQQAPSAPPTQAPAAAAPTQVPPTAAPAPTAVPAVVAKEPVTLRWSSWSDATLAAAWEKSVKEVFEPAHPGIKVTTEWAPYGEYHTKLLTALSAGTAPDLYTVARWYSNDYIVKGQAMDPTPFMEADAEWQARSKKEFPAGYLQNTMWQGKQWGTPYGGGTMLLYWNRKHFEEAKVEDPLSQYKAGKWNWDNFLKTAQALTKKNASGDVERYGFYLEGITWPFITAEFIWGAGGETYDMSTTVPTISVNSPEAKKGLQFLSDLYNVHKVAPLPGAVQGINLQQTGKVSMFYYWDGSAAVWNAEGDTWGIAPVPEGPAGRFAQGGCNPYLINPKCKHPEEAFELSKWLSLDAEKEWLAAGVWSYIGAQSILESDLFKEKYQAKPVELVPENRQFNRNVPQPLGAAEFESAFNPDIELFLMGEKSLDAVLADAKKNGDPILAEAYKKAGITG